MAGGTTMANGLGNPNGLGGCYSFQPEGFRLKHRPLLGLVKFDKIFLLPVY